MKNIPSHIYLVAEIDDDEEVDFNELHGVSWCQDRINKSDLVYVDPVKLLQWHQDNRTRLLGRTFESIAKEFIAEDNVPSAPDYEYETFFKSEPTDSVKIDGWLPIATDRIKNPEKIEEYIKNGILRKVNKPTSS